MDKISVNISECPVESILAEDVMNDNGVIVLKAGTLLTESKINSLERYGLESIVINSQDKVSAAELEAKKKQIGKILDKRMRRCDMNKEMTSLKNILISYRCGGFE